MTEIKDTKDFSIRLTSTLKSLSKKINKLNTNMGSVSSATIADMVTELIPFFNSLSMIRKSAKIEVEELRGKINEYNANKQTITRRIYLKQIIELFQRIDLKLRKEFGIPIDDEEDMQHEQQMNYEDKARECEELKLKLHQMEKELKNVTKELQNEKKKNKKLKKEIEEMKQNGYKESEEEYEEEEESEEEEKMSEKMKKEMKEKEEESTKKVEEMKQQYTEMKSAVSRYLRTLYTIVDRNKVVEDKVIALYNHKETMSTYRILFKDLIDLTRFKIDNSEHMEELVAKCSEFDHYKEAVRKGIQLLERIFEDKTSESKFDTCLTYKLNQLPDKFSELERKMRSSMKPKEVPQIQRSGGTTPKDNVQKSRFFGMSSTPRKRGGKK